MSPFIEVFIADIIQHLHERPDLTLGNKRNESWLTAAQIAGWIEESREIVLNRAQLDQELLGWWHVDPASRPIRWATYPEESTLERLWGHIERVGASPVPRHAKRLDAPIDLEMVEPLPDDALTVFISYANPDLHFAARVRLYLRSLGIASWIYAREIAEGDQIFEAVQAAIDRSNCMLALATAQSLASAWMFTETRYAVAHDVKTIVAFDGNNRDLMALLESWHQPHSVEINFDQEKLLPLKMEYSKFNHQSRIDKYESSAGAFLSAMCNFHKCVYPRRKTTAMIDQSIEDFELLIVKIQNGEWL